MKKYIVLFTVLSSVIFTSCPDPDHDTGGGIVDDDSTPKGVYVAYEGLQYQNGGGITYYNLQTGVINNDIFLTANGRGLGDVVNDLQAYGSNLWAVVNGSETLEIMKLSTCKSIKQILLTGKSPRKIAFYKNWAYVSCSTGEILRYDTATLEQDGFVISELNPEGLCVVNNKLYVANSGQFSYPMGNKVSVIDPVNLTIIKIIDVVTNPTCLIPANNDALWLISSGNYDDIPFTLQQINSSTDEVLSQKYFPVYRMAIFQNSIYYYTTDFFALPPVSEIKVAQPSLNNFPGTNFIKDNTKITTPYFISSDKYGNIWIGDANNYMSNGDVYCFYSNGTKKIQFEAGGICPCTAIFLYK